MFEVPAKIYDKESLLLWYENELKFPNGFGRNWDALEECLHDLSWIEDRVVVLYHKNIPLDGHENDQRIYISILANVVRDWKFGNAHEVVVAFDPKCELKLYALSKSN